jgi:hypothetical protein
MAFRGPLGRFLNAAQAVALAAQGTRVTESTRTEAGWVERIFSPAPPPQTIPLRPNWTEESTRGPVLSRGVFWRVPPGPGEADTPERPSPPLDLNALLNADLPYDTTMFQIRVQLHSPSSGPGGWVSLHAQPIDEWDDTIRAVIEQGEEIGAIVFY